MQLKNFKCYQEKSFEFSFGLTGIIGRNGAGKSTIFEAIFFALYGETGRNKEELKNSSAESKDEVAVTLEFILNGKEYRIERSLRGKNLTAKAELYNAAELIASSVTGVNEAVTKLLGMSKEAFVNTVFASQKELTKLSQLGNDERKRIIRRLLGLERVDRLQMRIGLEIRDLNREIKVAKEHLYSKEQIAQIKQTIKTKQEKLEELAKLIGNSNQELEVIQKALEALKKQLQEQSRLKENFRAKEADIAVNNAKLERLGKELLKLSSDIAKRQEGQEFFAKNRALLDERKNLQEELAKLQAQKEQQLRKEGLLKEQEQLRAQLKRLNEEIKELQNRLKEYRLKLAKKGQYKEAHAKYKEHCAKLEAAQREAQAKETSAKTVILQTKKQLEGIKKLGSQASCPTCTRSLLSEYESVVASLSQTIKRLTSSELVQANEQLKAIKERLDGANKKLEKIQKVLSKIEQIEAFVKEGETRLVKLKQNYEQIKQKGLQNKAELEKLNQSVYDASAHKTKEERFNTIEPLYKRLIGLEPMLAELPKMLEQKEALNGEQKSLEANLKSAKEELKKHPYKPKIDEELNKEHQALLEKKDQLLKQKQNQAVGQAKIKAEIASSQEKLLEDKNRSLALEKKVFERDDLLRLKLFLESFKSAINAKVTPRISQIASDLFFEITSGRYQHIEVDNAFDFYIYDGGKRYPIARFSGGEVDLANLVLRIAISKTLNELSSSATIGFLAFDEVFGSQDQQRRYAIMESFAKISEHYRQIFLISHDPEIKELFERVIEV